MPVMTSGENRHRCRPWAVSRRRRHAGKDGRRQHHDRRPRHQESRTRSARRLIMNQPPHAHVRPPGPSDYNQQTQAISRYQDAQSVSWVYLSGSLARFV